MYVDYGLETGMNVFEAVGLVSRAVIDNRPGDTRKLLEALGVKAGTVGGRLIG
jgi:hypothetical protein